MGICCSYFFEKEIYEDIEWQQGLILLCYCLKIGQSVFYGHTDAINGKKWKIHYMQN